VPISAERTVPGPVEEIWRLWTTADGLAAWWGAEDVLTRVEALDVRPGDPIVLGFEYAATANDPVRRAEFRAAGIPTSYRGVGTFDEVEPLRRLVFRLRLDFGPRAPATDLRFRAEFTPDLGGVRVGLTAEGSPNKHWALLGKANLEGQLERMARCGRDPPG